MRDFFLNYHDARCSSPLFHQQNKIITKALRHTVVLFHLMRIPALTKVVALELHSCSLIIFFLCLSLWLCFCPLVWRVNPCRSFAKPPKQVQVVCECILVMRGQKEISWKSAKSMMSEGNFLRALMEMDCDAINPSQVKTVRGR